MLEIIQKLKAKIESKAEIDVPPFRVTSIKVEKLPEQIEYKNTKEYFGKNCILVGLKESAYRYENPEVFACFLLDLLWELLKNWDNYIITKDYRGKPVFWFEKYSSDNSKIIGSGDESILYLKGMNKDILAELLLNRYPAANLRETLQIFSFPSNYKIEDSKWKVEDVLEEESYLMKSWSYGDGQVECMLFNLKFNEMNLSQMIKTIETAAKLYHLSLEIKW